VSVDAHCHIDLHADPMAVVEAAIDAGLRVVAVTTTPAAFKISSSFTNMEKGIIPALGMHPEVVGVRPQDIDLFSKYLDCVSWVGEVGLDGSRRFKDSWNAQVQVFERVLRECSDAGGRILSVHSRSATSKLYELISSYPEAGTPVLHWFSGRPSEVADGLALGAYFSVNYQMLQSKAGAAIVRQIPMNRLLTESDAPFANTDSFDDLAEQIRATESKLAEICGCQLVQMKSSISENFLRLTSTYSDH
jgi:TatD DNase family protein